MPHSESGRSLDEADGPTTLKSVLLVLLKLLLLLVFLYLFIVSLDFLSAAFRLVGAKGAGVFLQNSELLQNPIADLMIGVLVTCLLQSSSTTTSIIVTMVGADLITLRQSAFLIMGANIGTSITNTLVSLSHIGDSKEFEQAFAGATVHDIFNWLTVLVLLPLEAAFGPLEKLVKALFTSVDGDYSAAKFDILKALTKPLTNLVVQLDSKVVQDPVKLLEADTILKVCCKSSSSAFGHGTDSNGTVADNSTVTVCEAKCDHLLRLLHDIAWSDVAIGILLLAASVLLLSLCLYGLVRVLRALLGDTIKTRIRQLAESKKIGCLLGYVSIVVGAVLTFLVQSSSVFTSAVTPLVGTGVITLEIMYPLSLGANLGTTATGLLASLAVGKVTALQTALIHLFFNIIGICLWYPLPWPRAVPLAAARRLGATTAKYRWFAGVYILTIFFLMPLAFFGLSVLHWAASVAAAAVILLLAAAVAILHLLQAKRPQLLPAKLRNWKWLPLPLRSLQPMDRALTLCCRPVTRCCCCCCSTEEKYDVTVELENNGGDADDKLPPALSATDVRVSTG